MGHAIQAFITRADTLRGATRGLENARVIPIGQGLALLPNTDELSEEVRKGGGGGPAFEEFYQLSPRPAELAALWSAGGAVAYVETDYFGGTGGQAAVLWEGGEVVYGPSKGKLGPVNDVLRRMGVERSGHLDQFDAAGLGRHRSNRDWLESS